MLTLDEAREIVRAVKRDPECQRRINSFLSAVPAGLGISGSLRNWGYVLTNRDPTEVDTANMVCTGIADATMKAIGTDSLCRAALRRIDRADTIDRLHLGTHHTATSIKMADGKTYVFDWHATLNIGNPLLYPSAAAFVSGSGSVTFADFLGFDLPNK
ncbi:hypothetical protein [Sphingomonas sp.]|jgi:hypothetical protein|uniref:hypothetical protein n=1 Tax=Sphingomonas sp. TaxID=28214 RepID=UPI002ED8F3B7